MGTTKRRKSKEKRRKKYRKISRIKSFGMFDIARVAIFYSNRLRKTLLSS